MRSERCRRPGPAAQHDEDAPQARAPAVAGGGRDRWRVHAVHAMHAREIIVTAFNVLATIDGTTLDSAHDRGPGAGRPVARARGVPRGGERGPGTRPG